MPGTQGDGSSVSNVLAFRTMWNGKLVILHAYSAF